MPTTAVTTTQSGGFSLPSNFDGWIPYIGAAAGVWLMLNKHLLIGGAVTGWFGYTIVKGKPPISFGS